jgi:hypothetical protein
MYFFIFMNEPKYSLLSWLNCLFWATVWQQVLPTVSSDGYHSQALPGILRGSVIQLNLPVI